MKIFKKTILSVLLFGLLNSAFSDNAYNSLRQLLSATNNYSADFTQATTNGKNGQTKTSYGKIYLQKPNRFRWEISQPNPQIIVSDGHYLWVYDPSLMQMTQQKVTAHTFDPALLLTGNSDRILQQFKVTLVPGYSGWYQLQPKRPGSGILAIRLQYKNGRLSKIQLINNMNQRSLFTFSNIQVNTGLASNLFQLSLPKGATLLKQ